MITNLFSIFDPTSSFLRNWISSIFLLIFIPTLYFNINSRFYWLSLSVPKYLFKEIKPLLSSFSIQSNILVISIFIFILFNNILGLLSYNFTASSHITFTMRLALPVWLSINIYGSLIKTSSFLAHFIPTRTPTLLIPFITIIEIISSIIRPLTLAIRLAANIIAGHLLITLLNSYASISSLTISTCVISRRLLLIILELAVAIIQAYVFIILLTLYIQEI